MAILPSLFLTKSDEKKMMVIVVLAKKENAQQQTMILDGLMEPCGGWDCCGFIMHGEGDQGLGGIASEMFILVCSLVLILTLFWSYLLDIEVEGHISRSKFGDILLLKKTLFPLKPSFFLGLKVLAISKFLMWLCNFFLLVQNSTLLWNFKILMSQLQ